MNSKWFKISLLFFFSVALMGTILRASPYFNIPVAYKNLIHSHSHVAFQGWIYTLLFLMVTHLFLTNKQTKKGKYALQFKLTIMVIVGVMFSFIVQGYAIFSIIFSSLFQLMNYWFIYRFFKDTKKLEKTIALRFIKTGFWLGLLSTLAPWGIGILAAKGMANTEPYHSVIYFFLHFQYNGWFLFAVIGLIFKWLENNYISFNQKKANYFYWVLTLSVIPTYLLSLLGMSYSNFIQVPAILAAVFQLIAIVLLIQIILSIKGNYLKKQPLISKAFLYIALGSFAIKIILQFISVFPAIETYAFGNRYFILAYLHLCLIGLISFSLITLLFQLKWLNLTKTSTLGSLCLIVGFVVSEYILAASGLGWVQNALPILLFSALMAIGICFLLFNNSTKNLHYEN